MQVSDFIQEVNDALRGVDDDAPSSGTDEFNYWLRIANRLRRNLYRDASKQWAATFEVLELGAVSATTEATFDLDDEVISPASTCYVLTSEGHRHDFEIIKPQEVNYSKQQVYIAGRDPQTLYFTKEITSDDQIVGGTLYLPGYVMPEDFTNENETIIIDDPDWLITATAAKIAFNDLTYEDKYPDLNSEANSLYNQMVKNNRRGTYGNPRKSPYDVPKLKSADRR